MIFALKVSLGCGLASLARREVLSIAAGYLIISLFMGMAIELLPENALDVTLNAGMAMHLAVALMLVALGIMTARKWNSHQHDISRKTFWILSMPCPACLAASFISCSFLAGLVDIDTWKIGALVGVIFFICITIFSTALGRINGTPASLGNAMIFIGIFYILSILLIPAYLNSQKISFLSISPPLADTGISYLVILSLVALGFLGRRWGISL
jgi:predicted transporter